jgi:hypothetical protein
MHRRKNYQLEPAVGASGPTDPATTGTASPPTACIDIRDATGQRRNGCNVRQLDLSKWLGHGVDPWVYACTEILRYLLQRGDRQIATIVNYGYSGVPKFLEFLSTQRHTECPRTPADLQSQHLVKFVAWIKLQYPERSTAKSVYSGLRAVLLAMIARGLIRADRAHFFPARPFPNSASTKTGATPLSIAEKERMACALRQDIIALHHGQYDQAMSQALTVYLLAVALRTGGNTTPLLEMTRDSLKPHLLPNMMRIDLVKHRSATTQVHALRRLESLGESLTVPTDGVAILNKVIALTEPLRAQAPPHLCKMLWLFQIEAPIQRGKIAILRSQLLFRNIKQWVKRHRLLGDDGQALELTLGRLRKSRAHELWVRSDGDLIAVAGLMGNRPRVADRHYLSMTDVIRAEGAAFIGEVLTDTLRGPHDASTKFENTPVGRCKDPLHGDKAPGDGQRLCDQFVHCLGCRSYAIVGSLPDLHRLYSFQEFLQAEIDYFPKGDNYDDWRAHRQRLSDLIDHFTAQHFPAALISQAKALAENEPHRFWALQIEVMQRSKAGYAL